MKKRPLTQIVYYKTRKLRACLKFTFSCVAKLCFLFLLRHTYLHSSHPIISLIYVKNIYYVNSYKTRCYAFFVIMSYV